jgi:hypothetical protein
MSSSKKIDLYVIINLHLFCKIEGRGIKENSCVTPKAPKKLPNKYVGRKAMVVALEVPPSLHKKL